MQDAHFGTELHSWRTHRGLSQLDLALDAGVSSRHLSFLETGRARPSRAMVIRLMDTRTIPVRFRNRILAAAGFAPAYTERRFDEKEMAPVRRTLRLLLERHEPFPAYAMDGSWNIVDANRAHRTLLEGLVPAPRGTTVNMPNLVLAPDLLRPRMVDWDSCARVVLRRALHELERARPYPELAPVLDRVQRYPDVAGLLHGSLESEKLDLFVPVALRNGTETLCWLTTIMTFAGAVDVVVDELIVECFFPADDATDRIVRTLLAPA